MLNMSAQINNIMESGPVCKYPVWSSTLFLTKEQTLLARPPPDLVIIMTPGLAAWTASGRARPDKNTEQASQSEEDLKEQRTKCTGLTNASSPII